MCIYVCLWLHTKFYVLNMFVLGVDVVFYFTKTSYLMYLPTKINYILEYTNTAYAYFSLKINLNRI